MPDTDPNRSTDTEQKGRGQLEVDQFYHGFAVEPKPQVRVEGTLWAGKEGAIYFVNFDVEKHPNPKDDYGYLTMRESHDKGRTWGDAWGLADKSGKRIKGFHETVFRLKSGKVGLVYNDSENFPTGIPGRDGGSGIMFRESEDEGRTWTDPVVVYPLHALCCSGYVVVLSNGRIVAPAFRWIGHDPSPESEEFTAPTISYSFACVSDDEGKTWRASYSQLIISHYRFSTDLEEPAVIELTDGRLLMHLRSQVGRPYRSYSTDRGMTWSRPEPLPIAASYAPALLRRVPTGEILMIWNQSSRGESLMGLDRHRLSCAISREEGETWENFKNLESLDYRTVLEPPPADRLEIIQRWDEPVGQCQPGDTERYPRAPGVLRICYPDVLFADNEAVVVYDYGLGTLGKGTFGIKLRVIPVQWFTS